ncbi:MAG: DF family (seleno)protein [Phycisphaerae bacterium]
MTIEVLYLKGCPNYPPTLALVREVVAELGSPARVVPVEVREAADAERCRFPGSPTVRVNGIDIEPAARNRMDYAWGCRRYGRAGVPPRELIVAAIREQW